MGGEQNSLDMEGIGQTARSLTEKEQGLHAVLSVAEHIHNAFAMNLRTTVAYDQLAVVGGVDNKGWSRKSLKVPKELRPADEVNADRSRTTHLPASAKEKGRAADNSVRVWRMVKAGRILAAIDALPLLVRSWLIYAYAPPQGNNRARNVLVEAMYERWQAMYPEALERKQVAALVLCALADRSTNNRFSIESICEYVGISSKNWRRTWAPKYKAAFMDYIDSLDARGKAAVKKVL